MNFSTVKRIKVLISFFCVIIVLLSIAMTGSFIKNHDRAVTEYSTVINNNNKGAKKITIESADGVSLYKYDPKNGSYAKDESIRRAFFTLVGTAGNLTGQSILTQEKFNSEEERKKTHRYYGEKDITLTVDSKLQVEAYKTLSKAKSEGGSLMVVNYKTGEVLCAASYPVLDPMNIPETQPEGSCLFKPICAYTPGSVMKTVSVAAVLEKKPELADEFNYKCTGIYEGGKKEGKKEGKYDGAVSCHEGKVAHGNIDLPKALFHSCNCAIAKFTTNSISEKECRKFVNKIGLLEKEGQIVDFDCRNSGKWNTLDDYRWAVNGQADDSVTPAAMMRWYCALANDGVIVSMHIQNDTQTEETRLVSEETAKYIQKALNGKLDHNGKKFPVNAWGKTGTAEIDNDISHSWFICALDDKNAPPLCCLVMLEHGGESSVAKKTCIEFMKKNLLN